MGKKWVIDGCIYKTSDSSLSAEQTNEIPDRNIYKHLAGHYITPARPEQVCYCTFTTLGNEQQAGEIEP